MEQEMKWPKSVSHRIYEVRQELVEVCSICNGTGYLEADDGVYRCECLTMFRWVKELIKAGIPKDYWHLSMEELEIDPRVKGFIAKYINNLESAKRNGLGFVFVGANGTGKTSMMTEIAKHALLKQYSVRYFTMEQYITALYKKRDEMVAWYEASDFLLIDEMDKQPNTKTVIRTIDEFIRRMFNAGKCLLLAANWRKEDVVGALGQSTFSLFQRRNKIISVFGADYSSKLNQEYRERLEGGFDYRHENLLGWATLMEDASWQQ